MKRYFLLMLLILPVLAFSQQKVWTLEECITYAIDNHPSRKIQEATNEIYKINHREAIAGFLPSLSVETGASFNFGRAVDEKTNTYVNSNSFRNNYNVYSSLTLFDGFYQYYRTKITKLSRLRGQEQLEQLKDDIAFDLMSIFFNVLYYQGTVDLARKQLEESSFNLKRTQRMEELGLKSSPDVAEIQAKEAEDRYRLTQQTNLYTLELIKLKEKMNLDIEADISISSDLPVHNLTTKEDPVKIYQQALYILPSAQIADKSLVLSEMDYKASKSNLYPRISMGAGWSTAFFRRMPSEDYDPFWDQLDNQRSSYVSFSLSIPLFSKLSRISGVKRSKQNLIIAEQQRNETFRQIYSDIERTVADVNGLSAQYIQAQKRREASDEAHKMNQSKYEEGLINALELTTSSNRLLSAEIEELYVRLQYQVKYKLLEYYKGNNIY
ncbi:MAG: TolC family protein [Bacteroidales bacterium]|nr:TolC family protein [Bacteroidales bacterium]